MRNSVTMSALTNRMIAGAGAPRSHKSGWFPCCPSNAPKAIPRVLGASSGSDLVFGFRCQSRFAQLRFGSGRMRTCFHASWLVAAGWISYRHAADQNARKALLMWRSCDVGTRARPSLAPPPATETQRTLPDPPRESRRPLPSLRPPSLRQNDASACPGSSRLVHRLVVDPPWRARWILRFPTTTPIENRKPSLTPANAA